jgi:hypothetical protein
VAGLISLVMYLAPDLLTDKQITVVSIAIAFVAPIVTALFTRGKVWTPASVQVVVAEAVKRAQDEMKRNQEAEFRRNQIPYNSATEFPAPVLEQPRPMTGVEAEEFTKKLNKEL